MRCCETSRKDERRAREGSVERGKNERRGLSVDGKDRSIDPSLHSYLFLSPLLFFKFHCALMII